MAQEMKGKVAIVTGAARGIGQGMAEIFVEEGGKVVIADLLDDRGEELAKSLGSSARYKHTDVSKAEDVQALVDFAISEFGDLDVMVNNAGITDNSFDPLLEANFDAFDKIMAVNVKGTLLGTQIAGRHMAKKRSGSIINTSSISGIHAGFGFFIYRASKAGVVNFTKSAAVELGKHLVRVNCICPGNIQTEMGTFAQPSDKGAMDKAERIRQAVADARMEWQPLKRQGYVKDIANGALYFASDRSVYVTGQILSIDGGITVGDPKSQIADILAAREAVENQ